MTKELDWNHATDDIPETGLKLERTATPDERDAVAEALDLLSCSSLAAHYDLAPRGGGHFRLTGSLKAQVEQSCVVTLEPLTNEVAASFSVDYWPENELPEPSGGIVDVHEDADLEPIVGKQIKVGRVVFDALAGAIDLFPRKPGAVLEASEAIPKGSSPVEPASPFAALAKIKNKL